MMVSGLDTKVMDLENISIEKHKHFINIALELASDATIDMPIAALIVHKGKIISQAINQKEHINDPTAHAEMLVIREAAQLLKTWRLNDVILYSTLEPCPMCAAAIMLSRIPVVVFSAYDLRYGAMGSVMNICDEFPIQKVKIIGGIEEYRSSSLLKTFFNRYKLDSEKVL